MNSASIWLACRIDRELPARPRRNSGGSWTPIAGTLVILVEVCFAFLGTTQVRSNILLGVLGAALAVLGPGIRSIDALRYGRKRFDIRDP
jgi:hypothetical protein